MPASQKKAIGDDLIQLISKQASNIIDHRPNKLSFGRLALVHTCFISEIARALNIAAALQALVYQGEINSWGIAALALTATLGDGK